MKTMIWLGLAVMVAGCGAPRVPIEVSRARDQAADERRHQAAVEETLPKLHSVRAEAISALRKCVKPKIPAILEWSTRAPNNQVTRYALDQCSQQELAWSYATSTLIAQDEVMVMWNSFIAATYAEIDADRRKIFSARPASPRPNDRSPNQAAPTVRQQDI